MIYLAITSPCGVKCLLHGKQPVLLKVAIIPYVIAIYYQQTLLCVFVNHTMPFTTWLFDKYVSLVCKHGCTVRNSELNFYAGNVQTCKWMTRVT